jgi:2-keto-4-pentenoate hydratase/2-oxohepta-3-ene-1,7-dioic acid hydratase in catechol pathway
MRLVTFAHASGPRIGVRLGDVLVDLSLAAPGLPRTMRALLALGDAGLQAAAQAAAAAGTDCQLRFSSVRLLPPVPDPGKILCVGLNYVDHAIEVDPKSLPEYPVFFARMASTLVGHDAPLVRPLVSRMLDYEGEVAAVIGIGGRNIPREAALAHVAGYALFNEASVRDYQFRTSQWFLGKNFDDTGAFGPELCTTDELPPGACGLRLSTTVNGEVMQEASTSEMLFPVELLVATLSEAMILSPGDVIVTGTPSGVGFALTPPRYLTPGDMVEVALEGYGVLRNPVIDAGCPS